MTVDPTTTAPRPSRQARLVRLSAIAMSFLLAGFATVTTSRSAFNASTSNTANTASAAGITLTDNDSGTAMFTASNMVPGTPSVKCITVTQAGNLPTNPVKLYRSGAVTGTGLEQYLNMTVEIGTGTVAWPDCTGFTPGSTIYATNTMSNFMSTYTDWNSGLATWTPSAGNQSRVFRITLSLQDNNAAQGKDVTFGFTWEAQIS